MSNIYLALYDLLNTYIFGGSLVTGTYPDLCATLLAMCGCVFCFSLPFVLVWRVIKMISGN